jgi:cellulose synthase/poly-beta-1,6-N-acetylglucosamine synthase-like glycosyltransferase
MKSSSVAIVIPAYNEARVIAETLRSVRRLVPKSDIYVIDDCSTDQTARIARQFTRQVYSLPRNSGKGGAINHGILAFHLTNRYDYLLLVDADTQVDRRFINQVLPKFADPRVIAVVGKVVNHPHNWLTAYRLWEYEIGQAIHKQAQSRLGGVSVCPGCATIYRSKLFDQLTIPTGTVTEDMDLTFTIHRRQLGSIVHQPTALVYTQDPKSHRELYKQLTRWYKGFWQCLQKHAIPWGGHILDIEVALAATEGLLNSLLAIILLTSPLSWLVFRYPIEYLAIPLIIDLSLFMVPSLIWTGWRHRQWKLIGYIGHFYWLRIFSALIFFQSFLSVVWSINFHTWHIWDTQRYLLTKSN